MDKMLQGPDGDVCISKGLLLYLVVMEEALVPLSMLTEPSCQPVSARSCSTCCHSPVYGSQSTVCSKRWCDDPGADGGREPDRQAAGGAVQVPGS